MIIYPPSQSLTDTEVQISAHVEFRSKKRGLPQELWFRFPRDAQDLVSTDPDPFAVALLLVAMKNNEPIEVQGTLSKKLFHGLKEYQRLYHSWYPDRFKEIEIHATDLREDLPHPLDGKEGQDATAFSGGVDSFYTLLKLLNRTGHESQTHLTHALFMSGFDMPLNLTTSIEELSVSFASLMKEKEIRFIHGSTNVRQFVNTVDWTNAHGQALTATALFFKNSWNRFFIPSSYTHANYPKWGTHPSLDPLLSTESIQMVHHGADRNRIEKLETVSQSPESYNRLRVCWIQDLGLKNCGRCEKCVRTMIALDILGTLGRYSTFAEGLDRPKVRGLVLRTHQSRLFARELMWAARMRRQRHFFDLGYSLLRREIFYRKFKLTNTGKEG